MKEHELFDQSEFKEALKLFVAHTSKDFIEATNGVARDACFKFSGEAESVRLSKINKWNPERKRGTKATRRLYAQAATQ